MDDHPLLRIAISSASPLQLFISSCSSLVCCFSPSHCHSHFLAPESGDSSCAVSVNTVSSFGSVAILPNVFRIVFGQALVLAIPSRVSSYQILGSVDGRSYDSLLLPLDKSTLEHCDLLSLLLYSLVLLIRAIGSTFALHLLLLTLLRDV